MALPTFFDFAIHIRHSQTPKKMVEYMRQS